MKWSMALGTVVLSLLVARAEVPQQIHYQGRLSNGTNLVNGAVGLSLRLYAAPAGGTVLYEDSNTVTVVDGLYATFMGDQTNSGSMAAALTNTQVWVEVAVNGVALTPREQLASVGYALRSGGVSDGAITTAMLAAGAVTGGKILDGSLVSADLAPGAVGTNQLDLPSVDARYVLKGGDTMSGALTNEQGITAARFRNAHNTVGNDSAVAVGGDFNDADGTGATVSGGRSNTVSGFYGAIGGGLGNSAGRYGTVAGGVLNAADDQSGTVAGGERNVAAEQAVVAGGYSNRANGVYSVVGGGEANAALAARSAILGGSTNSIGSGAVRSFIGGGGGNQIGASSPGSAIVGGHDNAIAGRSTSGLIGSGAGNKLSAETTNCVILGGFGNAIVASENYYYGLHDAAILGGLSNRIVDSACAVIGGGLRNRVFALGAVVCGGEDNIASNFYAFIGGGAHHRALGEASAVGGGYSNSATAYYATVPGGFFNLAGGQYAFAAGCRAEARHDGTFVWSDAQGGRFASTGMNQFLIRAGGGVGIGTASPGAMLQVESDIRLSERLRFSGQEFFEASHTDGNGPTLLLGVNRPGNRQLWLGDSAALAVNSTNAVLRFFVLGTTPQIDAIATDGATPKDLNLGVGVTIKSNGQVTIGGNIGLGTAPTTNRIQVAGGAYCAGNGTAWVNASDKNKKEDFLPVDTAAILAKVAAMPVATWRYKSEDAPLRHIGPTAQDFHAAFGVGYDDTSIATVDADGVALAAIQALKRQLDEQKAAADAKIQAMERQNADLQARLEQLERAVRSGM